MLFLPGHNAIGRSGLADGLHNGWQGAAPLGAGNEFPRWVACGPVSACADTKNDEHHIQEWHVFQTHDEKHVVAICPSWNFEQTNLILT